MPTNSSQFRVNMPAPPQTAEEHVRIVAHVVADVRVSIVEAASRVVPAWAVGDGHAFVALADGKARTVSGSVYELITTMASLDPAHFTVFFNRETSDAPHDPRRKIRAIHVQRETGNVYCLRINPAHIDQPSASVFDPFAWVHDTETADRITHVLTCGGAAPTTSRAQAN